MAVVYLGLTLWLTRPWIAHPLTQGIGFYDQKHEMIAVDAMLSMTLGGWLHFSATELHQWPLAPSPYLMYPAGAAHGRSFDGLLLAAVTALLDAFMPLVTAHSSGLILGVFLCGFVFYRFASRLWGRGWTAFGLGLCSLCMPYLYQRLGAHPNLVYIWTVPLAMHLFHNFQRKPTWKRGLVWGVSFPLLALSSWYILIMGLVFQSIASLCLGVHLGRRRVWRPLVRLAAGWALGLALVVAVGWPMLTSAGGRVQYDSASLAAFSTPAIQYLLPFPNSYFGMQPWAQAVQQKVGADWEGWAGGPIAALLLLMVYALWPKARGPRATIALTALAAFVVSLGPYLHLLHAKPAVTGFK